MTDEVIDNTDDSTPASTAETDNQPRTYGGFATVEELEAAYAAATAAKEAPKDEGTPDGEEGSTDEGATDETETVGTALQKAGLDQDKYTREFAESGGLSDDSYAELEKAGYPRETVEVYMDGMKARRAAYEAEIYAPAGGQEGYSKLLDWAAKNLDEASVDAFNQAVSSGDKARARLAVSGLAAQFKGTSPAAPVLLNGKSGTSSAVQPFQSRTEVQTAMRDPRYRTDPAYRASVAERLRNSDAY